MQENTDIQLTVPLIKTTTWNNQTLPNILQSFIKLESIAEQVFGSIECFIDQSFTRLDTINNRIDNVKKTLQNLEKPGTKTTFYSAACFPEFGTSNIQVTIPSSSIQTDEEIAASIQANSTITNENSSQHSNPIKDGNDCLTVIESFFQTPTQQPPTATSYLYPSQVDCVSNLVSLTDPVSMYFDSVENLSISPQEYFYSIEETEDTVELKQQDQPLGACTISDDDDDDDDELLNNQTHFQNRRKTGYSATRVSLMTNDMKNNQERLSILHKIPSHKPTTSSMPSSKPPSVTIHNRSAPPPLPLSKPPGSSISPPSSIPSSKPSKPLPPQSFPNSSLSASTPISTQPSQRPPSSFSSSTPLPVQSSQSSQSGQTSQSSQSSVTRRPQNNMMSALCAEIRASGGRVSNKPTPPSSNPIPPSSTIPTPPSSNPIPPSSTIPTPPSSNPIPPSSTMPTPSPRPNLLASSGLLAEIQGADVKSILRQKREQLSASMQQQETNEIKEEKPNQTIQTQTQTSQQPQQLDLLQRRKLLFIDSSSSDESSDWNMSDYSCLFQQTIQLRNKYNKFSTVRTRFLYS